MQAWYGPKIPVKAQPLQRKVLFRINAYLRIVKFFMYSPEARNLSPEIILCFVCFHTFVNSELLIDMHGRH